ncbi:MAG TPA: alpha/beta hydrolase [Cyclobacteriaceae bacterium]|nr:alpha/beta hydrolase [Cyclobacteriaceae bacterium]
MSFFLDMKIQSIIFNFFCVAWILAACNTNKSDRFVEIDGHKQHILDMGTGSPVVIFITGAGADLKNFNAVQTEIAKLTRTLSYDRAGIGLSEELDTERSVDHFAVELNEILEKENIEPPYLVVSHSLGGFIARWFVHAYPDKVAGMVLIDPAYEGFMDTIRNTRSADQRRRMKDMVDLGIVNKPKSSRKELEMLQKDEELMRSTRLPLQIPITMLTSGRFSDEERKVGATAEDIEKWVRFHERLQLQAPQLKHIVTKKSGTFIHQEEPELVIAEIKSMLEVLRPKPVLEPITNSDTDTIRNQE